MTGIAEAVTAVRARIEHACSRAGRDPSEVAVIGATKFVPVALIREAQVAGLSEFGENYARDLAAKAPSVRATWHFIGHVQSGTARVIADHADVVHSAEWGKGLAKLGRRAARGGRFVRCLVQVDFTGHRQGIDPDDVESFLEHAETIPGIRVVGLMTIPPPVPEAAQARPFFARLRDVRDRAMERWPDLRELSMGMSADFEIAVEEGATMVRVGTALFGRRPATDAGPGTPGAVIA